MQTPPLFKCDPGLCAIAQYIFRLGISHTLLESRSVPDPKRNLAAMQEYVIKTAMNYKFSPIFRGC